MLKKSLSMLIACLLLQMVCAQVVSADSKAEKQAKFAEKVRTGIATLGVGESAVVELKLRDKTKLAGFVSEATADRFTVTDAKTGAATSIAYSNVAQVKGQNLSTGAKIAIGIAIGAGIALIILAIYLKCCTG